MAAVLCHAWESGPELDVRPLFPRVTVLRLVAINHSRVQVEASIPSDRTRSAERADTAAPRGRRVLVQLLKITVSGALLWWLLSAVDLTRLWRSLQQASWIWLGGALGLYLAMLVVSSWRWAVLLRAQGVGIRKRWLLSSFLVATFFNNFLPSNIGGDVIRIRDTATPANSRTLAATIVLIDRGLGLVALVLTAALGATIARSILHEPVGPIEPWMLWTGFAAGAAGAAIAVSAPSLLTGLASPLRKLHAEWVDERLRRISETLVRFRTRPAALVNSALGALVVQLLLVGFYGGDCARAAHPDRPLASGRAGAGLIHRANGADIHERLRRTRSDVRLVFCCARPAGRIRSAAVVRRCCPGHDLVARRGARPSVPSGLSSIRGGSLK